MKLIYTGKKNPKKVKWGDKEVSFVPDEPTSVGDELGKVLLANAGDIFKNASVKEPKVDPKKDVDEAPEEIGEAPKEKTTKDKTMKEKAKKDTKK